MSMNIPTSLVMMALVATFNLATGTFLLFGKKEFAIKAVLPVALFVLALASKNPELSELLATTWWPAIVAIATTLTAIIICDFSRIAVRLDRRTTRRHHRGTHRTTPARY